MNAHEDVAQHVKLIESLARHYRSKYVDHEDLLQEGFLGLTIALRTYDPRKGTKRSNWIAYVARQRMIDAIRRARRQRALTASEALLTVQDDTCDCADDGDSWEAIKAVCNRLTYRQSRVFLAWLGTKNRPRQSVKKIAQSCHVSRTKIKTILYKCLDICRKEFGFDSNSRSARLCFHHTVQIKNRAT